MRMTHLVLAATTMAAAGAGCDRASLDTGANLGDAAGDRSIDAGGGGGDAGGGGGGGDSGIDTTTDATPPDVAAPGSTGDQTAFSQIEALIAVTEFDARNYDARDPATGVPPIRFGLGVRVTVNGGTWEGRVPGLAIFANGTEVMESGSAGNPQQFSYQYYPTQPAPGSRFVVQFRHMGATYAVAAEPIVAEITTPRQGDKVAPTANLLVRWSGTASKPPGITSMSFLPSPAPDVGCTVGFMLSSTAGNEAMFAPVSQGGAGAREPPCVGEVRVDWGPTVQPVPTGPLRALRVTREVWRIQRFAVAP